jgi:hypothetical protein
MQESTKEKKLRTYWFFFLLEQQSSANVHTPMWMPDATVSESPSVCGVPASARRHAVFAPSAAIRTSRLDKFGSSIAEISKSSFNLSNPYRIVFLLHVGEKSSLSWLSRACWSFSWTAALFAIYINLGIYDYLIPYCRRCFKKYGRQWLDLHQFRKLSTHITGHCIC